MKYLVHTMASSDPGDGDIIEFKTKADAYDHVRAMAEGGAHRCIVYLQQVGGSFPVYAPEDDVRGGHLRDAGRKRARNNPTDAENDAEFTRGWAAGVKLLEQDKEKAFEWWRTFEAKMDSSYFDLGKSEVISECWSAQRMR